MRTYLAAACFLLTVVSTFVAALPAPTFTRSFTLPTVLPTHTRPTHSVPTDLPPSHTHTGSHSHPTGKPTDIVEREAEPAPTFTFSIPTSFPIPTHSFTIPTHSFTIPTHSIPTGLPPTHTWSSHPHPTGKPTDIVEREAEPAPTLTFSIPSGLPTHTHSLPPPPTHTHSSMSHSSRPHPTWKPSHTYTGPTHSPKPMA